MTVQAPHNGDDWLALASETLPVLDAYEWAVLPGCGAVVLFSGTVRDHAEGRDGVERLTYEAYDDQVLARFRAVADETRARWPTVGRLVIWHRTGELAVGESSVIVVASAPHRPEAFDAARFAIDAVKASAPIWKHERWADGADWGTGASDIVDATAVPDPSTESRQLQ